MGKKFTLSLLVLVATLLALPIQAQDAYTLRKAPLSKVMKGVKGKDLKKAYTFVSKDVKEVASHAVLTAEQKAEFDRAELKRLWAENMERTQIVKSPSKFSANTLEKKHALSTVGHFSGKEFVPTKLAQKVAKPTGAVAAKIAAYRSPRKIAAVDELVGDFMLVSTYLEYGEEGWEYATPAAGATPISIAKVDDTTISISGFTSDATEAITATIDVETSTISIPVGQTLRETDYGPIVLGNAQGDEPLTGSIATDGSVYIQGIWFDEIGGDGQYAGYLWTHYYYSYITPSNGTMSWGEGADAKSHPVYIEQYDAKTVTVYNFAGFETAIDVTMKEDKTFVIEEQPVFYYDQTYGYFYTTGILVQNGKYYLDDFAGTISENTLVGDGTWSLYSPTKGSLYDLFDPATITLTDGEFQYPVIPDVAATPANPEILEVSPYDASKGFGHVVADIPTVDVNGNDLSESKLFYQFFSDVEGDIQPIVYTASLYENLDEDLTIIPYTLDDDYDFDVTAGKKLVYLNFPFDYDRIGVKSIYTGGGETNETEIQWLTIKEDKPVIDVLPYENALNTEALFGEFTVLDVNGDGKTWGFDATNKFAAYSYSSNNAADDWFVSPAIKLEAGKAYHIALDAANYGYPERFEVKLGKELSADALTTEVIPATDVTEKDFITYENEQVTVPETGYYYIGIHAISDPDEFKLFVKNFVVEAGLDPAAPAAVDNFNVAAADGVLEATISFNAPTKTIGGQNLEDLDGIIVKRDGNVIKEFINAEGQIAWIASEQNYENEQSVESIDFGSGVTAALAAGGNSNAPKYYNSGEALRMYANNTLTIKGNGIKKVTFTLTGNDKQKKLAADKGDYALEGNIGTWTGAADEIVFSVPDGSGNQARIQKVVIEYASVVTPGASYEYVDNADDLTMGNHTYQVIAYNAAGSGAKSEEKTVFLSAVLSVPTTFDLTKKDVFEIFQVIDANDDEKTWKWSESYGTYYSYSSSLAADDYLVSAPVKFEAGKNYRVVVTANCADADYPEAFRVLVGKEATVAGLNTLIADTTWVATEEAESNEAEFTATEDGTYYVAIQAVSPANMWRLNISSLAIENGAEPTAPAAVTEFAAVAGEKGALEVNVSFNAPAKAVNGTDLTDNLTINVLRDGEVVKTFEAAAPGSSLNWKDENVEQSKTYVYQVVASNASGAGLKSDKVSVYVGFDVPADLANLTATDNATSIKFAWDKVGEVGATGGYVNPAAVDYEVWSLKIVETMFGQSLDYDQLLASETDKDNYVLAENTDEGEQNYKYWAVQPVNVAGVGTPAVASMLVGAPYTLPFFESFTGSAFHYIWDYSSNAGIFVSEESSDDDAVALQLTALDEPGTVDIFTGKVSLKNAANPTLLFDVKSATVSKINVIGSVEGGKFTAIQADAPVTSEYTTIKVPLNDLKDARFVQLGFSADFANATIEDIDWETYEYVYTWGDLLNIDNIRIVDLYEHDVEVALNAPASVVAGSAAKLQVKVSNNAENAANGFTLKLTAGEKEIYNKTFNEALKPFSSIDVEAAFETTVFDEAGDVTLTAEVVYENDLNPDNNADEAVITVKEPTATAPSNLVAEQTAEQAEKGEVTLTWTAPAEGAAQEVTEDFTAYENGANETGMVGEWTLVNANGKTKGSLFKDLELANDGLAKAWQVFNPEAYGITNPSFNGPNGSLSESYLISGYNLEGQTYPDNDDWLISPVLTGIAQEISFDISALDVQYGPSSYEVLASSTDTELASFTKVAGAELTTAGWGKVTAQLPEGTKFFAIRNTTPGDGALCVALGNIKYQKGGAKAESFNIYVDAATAGNTTEATAILKELAAGNHVFAVTAVYANGAESKPVTATLDVTNAINEILSSGKSFTIYTVDGKLINRQATNLNGLKGSYIINNKKVILK